jgi:Right handed beta helix region
MRILLRVLVLGLFFFGVVDLFAQGSLTPPGSPGPTMKSLDQIEARTPISAATFTINAPGSYYLTSNLTTPAGADGIVVNASNVTIDLNGFSLIGHGGANGAGVNVQGTQMNLCVKNGTITGFSSAGIIGDIGSSRFEKLIIDAGGINGITMSHDNEVRDCVITHNGNTGINMKNGCRVVQSIVTGNHEYGIIGIDGSTIESCTVANNGAVGVTVNYGSVVRDCTVRANGASGILFSSGSQIIGNTCDANGNRGLGTSDTASRIEANTCTYNGAGGMSITGNGVNLIVRNTCRGNGNGGGVDNNYGGLQNSTTQVFGHILDMSTPGQMPDSFGPWSNISY